MQIWIKCSLPVRWSSFLIPASKVQLVCLHGSGPSPNKSGEVEKCPLKKQKPVLIVTEGTAKLDNHKYKSLFHIKAKMIPYDEVETYVGHAPGGVCPFGVNEGVAVYLDESLRKFDTVYPAAGNGHTAVKLTLQELEAAAGAEGWVDVCKEPEGE